MRRTVAVVATVVAVALLVATSVAAAGAGTGPSTPEAQAEAKVDPFSKPRAMGHIRKLATDIGVRVRGTKNERKAARYVATKLEKFGYLVQTRKFDVDGRKSRNVTATWPGAITYPFVIGAHMDTVAGSPGANDNGSGTAVMLETARLFAGTKQASMVRFVGFGSEEYGTNGLHHVGSQTFVNRLGKKGRKWVPGMVSVDMIADGRPLIIGTAGLGPAVVARTLFRVLDKAGFNVTYRITCDCSDNGPFERAGIPGAFMWSGDEPNYHSSTDTVPNLSKSDLLRSGRAVRTFVKILDRDMIKRFRKH
jgi:aminopeptidase YwaD